MAVIAKMWVVSVRPFGARALVEMNCQYDQALSDPSKENQRFTNATPCGDMRIDMVADTSLEQHNYVYLLFSSEPECPSLNGVMAAAAMKCHAITLWGGLSRQVELCNAYDNKDVPEAVRANAVNLRLTIDNAAASLQFQAGASGYWLRMYDASEYNLDQVLAIATG